MFVSCTTTMFSQAYIDQDTLLPATHFPPLQPNQYFIGMGNRTPTPTPTPTPPPSSDTSAYALDQKNKTGGMRIPRKRSGKKDRHSKIVTAQGTRDRRMRLSLDIARRFFNLQDMLGFDKASSTVEWLLNKSKSAIKDLCRSFPSVHHHTEEHGDKGRLLEDLIIMSKKQKKKKKIVEDEDSSRTSQSSMAREESRTMARSRARERTLEKMRSGKVQKPNPIKPSSFQEQDEPLVKNSTPSSSTATYPKSDQGNNNISNFDENWGVGHITALQSAYGAMDTMHHHISAPSGYVPAGSTIFSTTSSDPRLQPQFADIQLYAKPWELFINPSLR